MTKTEKKVRHLRGKLVQVSSQRLQFKPYGYVLDFSAPLPGVGPSVYVELAVPSDYLVEDDSDSGFVVLSLDGLNALLKVTADSLDKLHQEVIKEMKGD